MGTLITYLVIGLFGSLLFFNFYFRYKILKYLKQLRQNKISLEWKHIKNKQLLESEIIPNYPDYKDLIRKFVNELHFSFKITIGILIFITILSVALAYG